MRRCRKPLLPEAWALCLLLLVVSSTSGCGEPGPVIGVVAGGSHVDAATLALEDALRDGASGGIDTITIRAGTNEAAPAVRAARRLADAPGVVAVVGHSNSAASLAASQTYNSHEIVQIAPTSSAVLYSQAGPYSYRLVPPDDRQGVFLAAALERELPRGAKLAVLYVNDEYGRGLRAAFLAALDRDRHPVIADLPHTERAEHRSHFAHTLDALEAEPPDAIVWLSRGTTLAAILEELRADFEGVPIFGGDALAQNAEDASQGDEWSGLRYVDFVELDSSPAARDFRERYRSRFGRSPSGPDLLTYDAMRLVIEGIRAGARDGPAMKDYLDSLGRERPAYRGVGGPIRFDGRGDVDRSYVMKVVPERANE